MRNKITKIAGIGAVLAAFAIGPAMASSDMKDWDGDRDGSVNQEEFKHGWNANQSDGQSRFSALDTDKDGMISEDEYNNSVYNSYDRDRNGRIDEPEFDMLGRDMSEGGIWHY